jgi:hypothetical protein
MPRTRARIVASTRIPSSRRLCGSATALSTPGARSLPGWRTARAELLEALRCHRHPVDDLRIAFTPRFGADDVAGRKEHHLRELHESSLAPSARRLSEEIPALPAVSPATAPAINPALRALSDPTLGRLVLIPLGGASESVSLSRNRRTRVFLVGMGILILRGLRSPGPRRLRYGVDELALGHGRSVLDTDARRKLDQFGLVVGLQAAVQGLPVELSRGALRRLP